MSKPLRSPAASRSRRKPKQELIAASLRQEIIEAKHAPGTQLAPHPILAKRFGASLVTVQLAVGRLAREGFIVTRPSCGTFVSERLPHLTDLALVFWNDPQTAWEWSKFYTAITDAARAIEHEQGCRFLLFHGLNQVDSEDRLRLTSLVTARRLAGMIFINAPSSLEGTPLLEEPGIPRVALMGAPLYPQLPVVSLNMRTFLERALDYLLERGRRRIAIVSIEHNEKTERRLHDVLNGRNLQVPLRWQQVASKVYPRCARNCVELLMHGPAADRPDGLLITDDNLAEHGLAGLVGAGVQVPQDVEAVVHCNFPCPTASVLPVKRLGFDIHQALGTCLAVIGRQRRHEPVPDDTALPALFEEELQPLPANFAADRRLAVEHIGPTENR